jgi:hypothetical protein
MDDVVGVLGSGRDERASPRRPPRPSTGSCWWTCRRTRWTPPGRLSGGSRAARLLLSGGDRSDVPERIAFSTDDRLLRDAHVVVENVTEDVAVKRAAHRRIDELCRGDALVAANTSAIPIAVLAKGTGHPERVVGTHFMNPVPQPCARRSPTTRTCSPVDW